ncbi:MAG TPA: hypothetical protein DCP75_00845 [Haliea salexigens]|uniref:Uncharacterized protein n=1 Tax=Haliea salexigens TaxID=287487 RepID=A0A3C1KJ65_9GAMM|nr:hypothetical protein [Haliea salexigens]
MQFCTFTIPPQPFQRQSDRSTPVIMLGKFLMRILAEQEIHAISLLVDRQDLDVVPGLPLHFAPVQTIAVYVLDLAKSRTVYSFKYIGSCHCTYLAVTIFMEICPSP